MYVPIAGLNRHTIFLWMLCFFMGSAFGKSDSPVQPSLGIHTESAPLSPDQLIRFDIPAQSLSDALNHYASVSGWPILFQGSMVASRFSSPLQGLYAPDVALHQLLKNSGLVAEKVATGPDNAYTLKEADEPAGFAADMHAVDFNYGARIQKSIWQALCADLRIGLGSWRALLRVRVDNNGHVKDARIYNSTGSKRRDAEVIKILQRVQVDQAPPPQMAQPLTMLVLPFDQNSSHPCHSPSGNGAP